MTSTVYVAKNVYGGDGMGRLGDGRVVFVPGAFAGETVRAEIVTERKGYVKARLVEVVDASEERMGVEGPVVPGMVYARMKYAAEMRAKEAQLAEFFERARIQIPAIENLTDEKNAAHYRNKVVYHFGKKDGAWVMGYREEPSHEIVDVTEDPLARPEINAALPEIRKNVFRLLTQGAWAVRRSIEEKADVTIRWTARTGVKWWIGEAKDDVVLKETTLKKVFEVPAGGFYQVNPVAGETLVKAVVEAYQARPTEEVLDLYCGVGVFGLCCAPTKLTGIESGRRAIEFAKRNAASQGYGAAHFFAEQVGRNMRRISIGEKTTVIVDPPRGGLERGVPEWLGASKAPRIIYVSCDPATLMRDLRVMTRTYEVEAVKWVDMFPRTARFETMVVLRRK